MKLNMYDLERICKELCLGNLLRSGDLLHRGSMVFLIRYRMLQLLCSIQRIRLSSRLRTSLNKMLMYLLDIG